MPFIQLDDQITEHPKLLQAGAVGAWVWVSAIAYCQRQLTDGFVPDAALSRLAQEATPKVLARLVRLRLLDRVDGGYCVHDYLSHNPSRETVLRRRAEAAQRKERHRGMRDGRVPERVTERVTDTSSRARIPTPTPTPEETHTPRAVVPFDGGAMPTRRRKAHCAFESAIGVDVPQFLHDEFADKLRNAGRVDVAQLYAWYAETERAHTGQVIGEDAPKFWRKRFAEWQSTVGKVAGLTGGGTAVRVSSSVAVEDPDYNGQPYRFHCAHTPTCTTWPQHRDHAGQEARTA